MRARFRSPRLVGHAQRRLHRPAGSSRERETVTSSAAVQPDVQTDGRIGRRARSLSRPPLNPASLRTRTAVSILQASANVAFGRCRARGDRGSRRDGGVGGILPRSRRDQAPRPGQHPRPDGLPIVPRRPRNPVGPLPKRSWQRTGFARHGGPVRWADGNPGVGESVDRSCTS